MSERAFDPTVHLIRLPGKGNVEYLETKWRLVWLRAEHPDAVIETELVELSSTHAVFRARVSIPGGGSATGYGSETADDFRDYIEKAETKALGRALAALGYGTQFTPEFDDSDSIADSPVRHSGASAARRSLAGPSASGDDAQARAERAEKARQWLSKQCEEHGVTLGWILDWLRAQGKGDLSKLRREDLLQARDAFRQYL